MYRVSDHGWALASARLPPGSAGATGSGRAAEAPGRAGRLGALTVSAGGAHPVDGQAVERAGGSVPEIQRARILAALVQVTRERGAPNVTVADIVTRSGVSRRTFYELFADREDCFQAAVTDAVAKAAAHVIPAYEQPQARSAPRRRAGHPGNGQAPRPRGTQRGPVSGGALWRARVRAGLLALLEFLEEEPALGALCLVDTLAAGPVVLAYRAQLVELLIDTVDDGRGYATRGLEPSGLTAEGIVEGILGVLYTRLASGTAGLVGLLSPLMAMIVLPYLGPAAAAREAALPTPPPRQDTPQRTPNNPLQGLGMRLTYRTVQVLAAIDEQPGASNRQVADAAGIHDQGQISKLLTRLEHLGLVHNDGAGGEHGEPNAWQLTPRGLEVRDAIKT